MSEKKHKADDAEIIASAEIGAAMAKEMYEVLKQDFADSPNLSALIFASFLHCAGDVYNNFDSDKTKPFFFRKIAEAFCKMADLLEDLETKQ